MLQFYPTPETTCSTQLSVREHKLIQMAVQVLERRIFQREGVVSDPAHVQHYLRLKLAGQINEAFGILLLDSAHQILSFDILFTGTINHTTVHPRVIVQRALLHNAAAVILVHNHPSGATQPSAADRQLTVRIQEVMAMVDVRVLDHFIVGCGEPYSFATSGLL